MIKQCIFAVFAVLAVGAVQAESSNDFAKEAINATVLAPLEATTGSSVPSDFLLDAAFDFDGLMPLWPPSNATWSKTNDSVRVFPWVGDSTTHAGQELKGYYIVGKQLNVAGNKWRAWISRFRMNGSFDTSFGTNGWIYDDEVDAVVDAQMAGSEAYILVNIGADAGGLPPVTQVRCLDLSTPTGSGCFTFLGGIQAWGVTAAGPRTAAYGQRLLYDSRFGLYVAARIMNNDRGQEVGIARISADDGLLVTEFRGDGYNIGLPSWANEPNAVVAVNALALTPAGTPGGTRLYVAGQMSRSPTDSDGFILGLGATTGSTAANFNWNNLDLYYEQDNAGDLKDAITAMTVQRNGKVVYAGWSNTDFADTNPMFLGRLNADGTFDAAFCAGSSNRGGRYACLVDPPASGGTFPLQWSYKPVSLPVAIVERRQNRDLVLVQRFQDNGSSVLFPPEGSPPYDRVRTLVQQFSANGNTLHATRTIDYPGAGGGINWSRPFAMWMGGSGDWNAIENTGAGEEVLIIAGTRQFGANNFDATLSHLKSNDSIFADQFGGAHND